MEFEKILSVVRGWAGRVPFPAEVLRDDPEGLRIIWETEKYLAELIVCRAEYAPYRWVSFTILDVRRDPGQEPVYCYYDQEDSSVTEILAALERGMEMMTERREAHV